MILVGLALIILGGVFVFAGLTGTPRAVLGIAKAAPPAAGTPEHNPVPPTNPPDNPSRDLEFDAPTPNVPEQPVSPPENRESAPPAQAEGTPVSSLSEQASPEIPTSRRISTIVLGIIGVVFGILAVLDSV